MKFYSKFYEILDCGVFSSFRAVKKVSELDTLFVITFKNYIMFFVAITKHTGVVVWGV